MEISKFIYLFCFTICILIFSCKATVENQTAKFDKNLEKANLLAHTYPVYSSLITNELKEIQSEWTEALAVTDSEEKAETLAAVNKRITSEGIVGKLYAIDNKYISMANRVDRINARLKTSKRKTMVNKHLGTYDYWTEFLDKQLNNDLPEADSKFFAEGRLKTAEKYLKRAKEGLVSAENVLYNERDSKISKNRKNDRKTKTAKR